MSRQDEIRRRLESGIDFPRSDLRADIEYLLGEVDHWKSHAEEAGAGFARACQDYARVAARNTELARRLEAEVATWNAPNAPAYVARIRAALDAEGSADLGT